MSETKCSESELDRVVINIDSDTEKEGIDIIWHAKPDGSLQQINCVAPKSAKRHDVIIFEKDL